MADAGITGVAVYLQPGMQLDITQPLNSIKNNGGFFALTDITTIESITELMPNPSKELLHGFLVENIDVGTLAQSPTYENGVRYTHKVGSENAIWFFARTGHKGVMNIINVPIHDHSSIVQGGPAYGTYFDDDEEAAT